MSRVTIITTALGATMSRHGYGVFALSSRVGRAGHHLDVDLRLYDPGGAPPHPSARPIHEWSVWRGILPTRTEPRPSVRTPPARRGRRAFPQHRRCHQRGIDPAR